MTKFLGFAGKKQSGKNTCCNFLQMLKFHEYGVCKNASLNEQGQILVSDLFGEKVSGCLLYTSPSPRDVEESRMPSSA